MRPHLGNLAKADEASNLAQHDRPNGRDLTMLGRMVLTEKGYVDP